MTAYDNLVVEHQMTSLDEIDFFKEFILSNGFAPAFQEFVAKRRGNPPPSFADKPFDVIETDPTRLAQREAIFRELDCHGVETATVTYCGSGDSGEFDSVEYNNGFDGDAQISYVAEDGETESQSIDDAIESLAEAYVGDHHSGWENNEGGRGTVTFHTATKAIELDHYDIIEEEEGSHHKL